MWLMDGFGGCGYPAILAYSCKCKLFCPSYHQKRVLLFAEWLNTHILEPVSHAQYVFTIPKFLRPIFKYHRRELGLLCKSAWQALMQMFQEVSSDSSAVPGVAPRGDFRGVRLLGCLCVLLVRIAGLQVERE